MKSDVFTRLLQKHGLWRKNLGLDCLIDLAVLIESPSPMVKTKGKSPCSLKCASYLIAAGFARLNRDTDHYEATDAGRAWHKRVVKLLPQN